MIFNTTQVKENYRDTQTLSRKYTQEGKEKEGEKIILDINSSI